MAGCQKRDACRDQFGLVEHVAALLRGHERADQIVLGLPASRLDQLKQPLLGFEQRFGALQDRLDVGAAGAVEGDDVVRPLFELVAVLRRDAQRLRDDDRGQRIGEIANYFDCAAALGLVEQVVDDFLHSWPHPLHHARGKCLVDQIADTRVLGRVGIGHSGGEILVERADPRAHIIWQLIEERGDTADIGKAAMVAQRQHHVVVARQHPAAPGVTPVDRVLYAQPVVDGIWIADYLGRNQKLIKRGIVVHSHGSSSALCVEQLRQQLSARRRRFRVLESNR